MAFSFLNQTIFRISLYNWYYTYIAGLEKHNLTPDDIDYVVCTHGHSDHIGNNNLFLKARHIVGLSYSYKDHYFSSSLDTGMLIIILHNKFLRLSYREMFGQHDSNCYNCLYLCELKEYLKT